MTHHRYRDIMQRGVLKAKGRSMWKSGLSDAMKNQSQKNGTCNLFSQSDTAVHKRDIQARRGCSLLRNDLTFMKVYKIPVTHRYFPLQWPCET